VFSTTSDGASSPTERLRITSAGLVGIGTSAPGALLSLQGTFGTSLATGLRIDGLGTTTDNVSPIAFYNQSSGWGTQHAANIACGILSGTNGGGYLRFSTSPDGNTAPAERLRITATGLVGIGTTTPGEMLHVNGNIRVPWNLSSITAYSSDLYYQTINFRGDDRELRISSIGDNLNPSITFVTGTNPGTERARIDSSGRLLVGTSSARANFYNSTNSARFQIEGSGSNDNYALSIVSNYAGNTSGAQVILAKSGGSSVGDNTLVSDGNTIGQINFQGADGTEFVEAAKISAEIDGTPGANDMPGRLVFSTTADGASSPTERMRIDSAGRAGFTCVKDDNAAVYILHNGTNGTQYGIAVNTANDQNDSTRYFLNCTGASTVRAVIRADGGLANYSANNANLSDINSKKDISPAADTWNCLKEWEIVNYRYKDQSADADLNLGVIAQQVAESCPEVITVFEEAKDDQPEKLGVKEQQMYWMAIKALQEAQVRIEQLESKVAALESA
jgi:hypothetical protein